MWLVGVDRYAVWKPHGSCDAAESDGEGGAGIVAHRSCCSGMDVRDTYTGADLKSADVIINVPAVGAQ